MNTSTLEQRYHKEESGLDEKLGIPLIRMCRDIGGDPRAHSLEAGTKRMTMLPLTGEEINIQEHRFCVSRVDDKHDLLTFLIASRLCGEFGDFVSNGQGDLVKIFDSRHALKIFEAPFKFDIGSEILDYNMAYSKDWEKNPSQYPFYWVEINHEMWAREEEMQKVGLSRHYYNHLIAPHYHPRWTGKVVMMRISENVGIRSLDFADTFGMFLDWARVCMSGDPQCKAICKRIPKNLPYTFKPDDDEDDTDDDEVEESAADLKIKHPDAGWVFHLGHPKKKIDCRYSEEVSKVLHQKQVSWEAKYISFWNKHHHKAEDYEPDEEWCRDTSNFSKKTFKGKRFPFTKSEINLLARLAMGLVRSLFPSITARCLNDVSSVCVDPSKRIRKAILPRAFFEERLEAALDLFRIFGILTFGPSIMKNLLFGSCAAELEDRMMKRYQQFREQAKKKIKAELKLPGPVALHKRGFLLNDLIPRVSHEWGASFQEDSQANDEWYSRYDEFYRSYKDEADDDEGEVADDEDEAERTVTEEAADEGIGRSVPEPTEEAATPETERSSPPASYPDNWDEEKFKFYQQEIDHFHGKSVNEIVIYPSDITDEVNGTEPTEDQLEPFIQEWKSKSGRRSFNAILMTRSDDTDPDDLRKELAIRKWKEVYSEEVHQRLKDKVRETLDQEKKKAEDALRSFDKDAVEEILKGWGWVPAMVR